MIILRPKTVIFEGFWPVSKFHFSACSTLVISIPKNFNYQTKLIIGILYEIIVLTNDWCYNPKKKHVENLSQVHHSFIWNKIKKFDMVHFRFEQKIYFWHKSHMCKILYNGKNLVPHFILCHLLTLWLSRNKWM